jgi:hypothetical protein
MIKFFGDLGLTCDILRTYEGHSLGEFPKDADL